MCVIMLLKISFNLIGMLAWAVVSTILIILILIKRWLLEKCQFHCPQAPTPDDQSTPASQPPPAENI